MTTTTSTKPKPTTPKSPLVFNEGNHTYRLDGRPVRGVTGLIGGGTPKDALIYWSAEQAGKWAVEHLAELPSMDPDQMIREMKFAHKNVRDAAGITGTAVHDLAEQLALTGEVEAVDEYTGYVEGYAAFLDEWDITPVLTERPCANRKDWYAGKFDMLCTSPHLAGGELVQIDLKTSKGVYGETAMQTAAYAKAEFYMDVTGEVVPMPKIHATYVAHVTPLDREGEHARYEGRPLGTSLYQLAGSPEEIDTHYGWFLAAAYTAKTTKLREKLVGDPIPAPVAHAA